MTPDEKSKHDVSIAARIEAYADARYRDGVKVGLDAAEFVLTVWTSGQGMTKGQAVAWAREHIEAARRKAGL